MRYVSNDYLTSMQRNIERSVDKIFTTLIKKNNVKVNKNNRQIH